MGRGQILQAGRAAEGLLLQCHRGVMRSSRRRGSEDSDKEPGGREATQAECTPWSWMARRAHVGREWDGGFWHCKRASFTQGTQEK